MQRYRGGITLLYHQTVLRFLGDKPGAIQASSELRDRRDRLPRAFRREYIQQLLDYNCNLASEEELLQAARPSKRLLNQAHFYIALTRLADGDRDGAREHFQKSVATKCFYPPNYHYSRAFLARMKDPTWPRWIKPKSIATTEPATEGGR